MSACGLGAVDMALSTISWAAGQRRLHDDDDDDDDDDDEDGEEDDDDEDGEEDEDEDDYSIHGKGEHKQMFIIAN